MERSLSIAMTTYNGERFLRQQLDSIYSQSKLPDEVVVCDDNSSDGTVAILEEYKVKYGLKYYVNNPGLGVNENFYKAISLCSGDYIALSDQDDIWLPNKIELTYNKLLEIDDGKPSVVSSQRKDIDAEGNIINDLQDIPDSFGYAATILGRNNSQGCTLMMNRELADVVLENKDADLRLKNIMFDYFISFTAAVLGNKYNMGNRLMLYRHHQNNVVAKINSRKITFRERIVTYDKYTRFFIPDVRFQTIEILANLYYSRIEDVNIRILIDKIRKIGKSSMLTAWGEVIQLKELGIFRRLSIILVSMVVSLMKNIVKS